MGVFSAVKSFVLEKFWEPATGQAASYNVFNTSFYAVGFGAAAAYIGFPALKKMDVKIDRRFFLGITPFVLLGGAVRVLEDRALVESVLLVTPFIYFLMFFVTVGLLAATRKIWGDNYYRPLAAIGSAGFLATASLYAFSNIAALPLTLAIFSVTTGTGYLAVKHLRPSLAAPAFVLPVAAHYWDAASSVVALFYGGAEKHVLAQFFVDVLGLPGMFVMKTLVIVPVVYLLVRDMEGEKRLYYLFLVAVLGLALGTRNLVSVMSA
ncbi:MAG: DUF63 family protein [Candidatus Nanohaloarchaea archaeon]